MPTPDDLVTDTMQRFSRAVNRRGTLDSHLEKIAKRVLPNYSGTFATRGIQPTPGAEKTEEMVDATAALALTRFAAAMESMLTPRHSVWHQLMPSDRRLSKDRQTRLWLEDLNDKLFDYRYAPVANFSSQKHEDYMALGAFGTGCMFIDAFQDVSGRKNGMRYRAVSIAEIYFLENHQGVIDTAMRRFPLTPRQSIQKFGSDNKDLPDDILKAIKDKKDLDKDHWFIHCVRPRTKEDGYEPMDVGVRGFPYGSYYICETGKKLVREGGYQSMPYSISRYVIAPGEIYGRSPAMMALPAINVLNEEKKIVLKQGHRTVDPVLLAFDDGVVDRISLKPGAINTGGVNAEGKRLIQSLEVGNVAVGRELMQEERQTINDFFLVTLFQILVETPSMTATEVLERAREKGALLSPTMGRQQSESLGPMIEREIDILMQQGVIGPMPPALREAMGSYRIEYDSPLTRMAKAENVAGLFRTVDWLREYVAVTGNPEPLDHIDFDSAMPDIMATQAVPVSWQRSKEAVLELRKSRQDEKLRQQVIDAAPAAAGVIKAGQAASKGQTYQGG